MSKKCTICSKTFSNTNALSSHLKSHYAFLPLPSKTTPQPLEKTCTFTKPASSSPESSQLSSVPDLTWDRDEDVALCLIMMSKDTTRDSVTPGVTRTGSTLKQFYKPKRRIFECPFCCKVFGSGQAMGGHKRAHYLPNSKKVNINVASNCHFNLNFSG